jgi:hypothetical protein
MIFFSGQITGTGTVTKQNLLQAGNRASTDMIFRAKKPNTPLFFL